MSRFGSLGTQYFDDEGDPLISGKIHFYEPGQLTPAGMKNTFADVNQTIANPNPVLLTAAGRQPNIFFSGSAAAILTSADDVQIEVRDPVGGDDTDGAFSDWNSDTVYNVNNIVIGSDGSFYLSITDGNEGNDPTASSTDWTQIRFIRVWNVNETYDIRQLVQGSGGLIYRSLTNSNTGNDPLTDLTNWGAAVAADVPAVIRAAGKTFAYRNF